jgi:hypothetical protein
MARRRRGKKIARETAMAVAMLVLVLFIAGAFIYLDNFDGQRAVVNGEDVGVGYVSLEVTAPQNSTNSETSGAINEGEQINEAT